MCRELGTEGDKSRIRNGYQLLYCFTDCTDYTMEFDTLRNYIRIERPKKKFTIAVALSDGITRGDQNVADVAATSIAIG